MNYRSSHESNSIKIRNNGHRNTDTKYIHLYIDRYSQVIKYNHTCQYYVGIEHWTCFQSRCYTG